MAFIHQSINQARGKSRFLWICWSINKYLSSKINLFTYLLQTSSPRFIQLKISLILRYLSSNISQFQFQISWNKKLFFIRCVIFIFSNSNDCNLIRDYSKLYCLLIICNNYQPLFFSVWCQVFNIQEHVLSWIWYDGLPAIFTCERSSKDLYFTMINF